MKDNKSKDKRRQILGRVSPEEFVGRAVELKQLVNHPRPAGPARGMLLLLAPSAGVSELLRQAYDQLFNQDEGIVPIYFSFTRNEITAVSAAIEFLKTFLRQYIAYRRDEPALVEAGLTLNDLVQLTPPADLDWIEALVEGYNRERFSNDDRSFVRFCFSAPQRVPVRNGRPCVLLDAAQLPGSLDGRGHFGAEILRAFSESNLPFVLAGLRRQVLDAAHRANCNFEALDIVRLGRLADEDARRLVDHAAIRQQVVINEQTRDLLVQQFEGSPFFITAMLQAAHQKNVPLDSYLDCEQLYVDELMGGRVNHYFNTFLEEVATQPELRRSLIRVLWESTAGDLSKISVETLRKVLHLEAEPLEKLLQALHVQEFVNWNGALVEVDRGPAAWRDYLKVRFQMDISGEPRAQVVADAIAAALKRAPHTMARHYRSAARLGLRELLERFDCQRVPKILFDSAEFNETLRGSAPEQILAQLESSDELRVPQVVHVANCEAYGADSRLAFDEERAFVARAFEDAIYTDANETIWLVAEVDSKLEAGRELTESWCVRLETLAKTALLTRTRIWLISNEGFSEAAMSVLKSRGGYGSSRQQVELLTRWISGTPAVLKPVSAADEFELVLPMGENNELVAASIVEQIARRSRFRPEAINQIKTAIVEAYINASEHSLSPDRKIYQRFRVESDKLVITISSRGVVPASMAFQEAVEEAQDEASSAATQERRGWGLKLIKTLMDEVEFERVDEGTSLRMTKYLRE